MSTKVVIPSSKLSVVIPQGICSSCSSPSPKSYYVEVHSMEDQVSSQHFKMLTLKLPLCTTCEGYHQAQENYKEYAKQNDPSFVEHPIYRQAVKIVKLAWVISVLIEILVLMQSVSKSNDEPKSYSALWCGIPLMLILATVIAVRWLNNHSVSYDKNIERKIKAEAKEKWKGIKLTDKNGNFVVETENDHFGRLLQIANS